MGCEWTAHPKKSCPTCGHSDAPVRIGHSAIGWAFGFDPEPISGRRNLREWSRYLTDKIIMDEYEKQYSLDEFSAFVIGKEGLKRPSCGRDHDFDPRTFICDKCGVTMQQVFDGVRIEA